MKFPKWSLLVFPILAILLFIMFPIPAIVVAVLVATWAVIAALRECRDVTPGSALNKNAAPCSPPSMR